MQQFEVCKQHGVLIFDACVASGFDEGKLETLFAPLVAAVEGYYAVDLTDSVQKAITAQMHGCLREGFTFDRPVRYYPCGGAPTGWDDVGKLFTAEDGFVSTELQAWVDSIVEVTPPATGEDGTETTAESTGEGEAIGGETYYVSNMVDEWAARFSTEASIVQADLALIAAHGNAVCVIPGADAVFGGARMLSAPSDEDLKRTIYIERHYGDLIRTRGLNLEVYA